MRAQIQHPHLAMLVIMSSLIASAPTAIAAKTSHHDAPQQLQVPTLAYDESSIVLVWKAPENTSKIVDYQVYSAGKLLGKASDKPILDCGRITWK